MEKTYTVKQMADMLGYSTNSIYTFLKEGKIKGVRIGKGRFRISQEELDKLLHLKKSQEIQSISVLPSTPAPAAFESEEIPSLGRRLEEMTGNIPSLFDWFVSLASIIIGFTLILFVRTIIGFSEVGVFQYLSPIKINLLVAGIGLLIVNALNQTRKKWYFIFNLIILLDLLAFSLMLFINKDLLGFTIFGLLSLMMFFHWLMNLKGVVSFALYVSLLIILLPIVLIIFSSADISILSYFSTWSSIQVAIVWLLISGFINGIIWLRRDKRRFLFWINFLIFSVGLIYFSYLYTSELYWSRALIFILILLSMIISSFWHKLNLKDKETQKTVARIFSDMLIIFLVIISVVWLIQKNIRSYAQDELTNKLVYVGNLVESTINFSKESIETLSKDESLIKAVRKTDDLTLKEMSKNIFKYSSNFRRLLIADEEGDMINIYPETTIPFSNIAFREYFKEVKASKKSYFSNLFETSSDGVKIQVVVIVSPILDEENNFLGVLIGSLDINSLTNNIQKLINSYDRESFLVLDREGKIIIKTKNLSESGSDEIQKLMVNQTDNNYDVKQVINIENGSIQIHGKMTGTNWILVLRRSLENVYNFNSATNLLLNLIIIGAGLLVIFWNLVHLKKGI